MVRSLPRKLPTLVTEKILLNGYNLPANTPQKEAQPGWHECIVRTSPNGVLWLLFQIEDRSQEFGLHFKQVWRQYEQLGTLDFEAGGEDGFTTEAELEHYLRSYAHP